MRTRSRYAQLLRHPLWQQKRLRIMDRDGFKCTKCQADNKTLNVHHTYYTRGVMPWQYPDESLKTLCEDCHGGLHDKQCSRNPYPEEMEVHGLCVAKIGEKVVHREYGDGQITKFRDRGEYKTVSVRFRTHGEKTFDADRVTLGRRVHPKPASDTEKPSGDAIGAESATAEEQPKSDTTAVTRSKAKKITRRLIRAIMECEHRIDDLENCIVEWESRIAKAAIELSRPAT